jgi:hypothetical protein
MNVTIPAVTARPVATFEQATSALRDVQSKVQSFLPRVGHADPAIVLTARDLSNAALDAQRAADMLTSFDWAQAQGARTMVLEGSLQLHVAAEQARGEFAGNVDENVRWSVNYVNDKLTQAIHLLGH